MRHFLPLTLLLFSACATSHGAKTDSKPAPTTNLREGLEVAAAKAIETCRVAVPGSDSYSNRCRNAFELRLRSVESLSNYSLAIEAAANADDPAQQVATAMESLLREMAAPGMPSDVFMEESLRSRLVAQVAAENDFRDAWKLASMFSSRVAEVVSKDLAALHTEVGMIALEVLNNVSESQATDAAYLSGLRNKKVHLREAVLKDMKEGLPPGWDPAPDLVVVEKLLENAEAEERVRVLQQLELEAVFDLVGSEIERVRAAFSGW